MHSLAEDSLGQAVAKWLFDVVIHQVRRPGSPVLTGMGPVKQLDAYCLG